MTTKNLVILAATAAVLGGAAYFTSAGKRMKTPNLTGRKIFPSLDVSKVARVEIKGAKPLTLAASDDGWKIETLHNYPADIVKIRENLLKLQDLTVGQVANGRTIAQPATVELKNAAGAALAALPIGETRLSKPKGQMAQFGGGGYPDGRYVSAFGKTVLVKETLAAFDGDPKQWTNTRIASIPAAEVASVTFKTGGAEVKLERKDNAWTMQGLGEKEELDSSKTYSLDSALSYLDFTGIAAPQSTAEELGLTTGAVYVATLKNGQSYTATLGGAAGGTDRWVKLAAAFAPAGTNTAENAALEQAVKDFNDKTGKWVYSITSWAAGNFAKTRADLVKAKAEPEKDGEGGAAADETPPDHAAAAE